MQVVPKNIFEELFISTTNKNFGFIPSQSKLLQGDQFYFNFESKQNAYLSVLDVYEDGTVSIIYENKKIFKNKQLKVPDENFEYNLEAGLYEEGKATYDIFLAILSPTMLNLSRFSNADEDLVTGEANKKFDELLEFIKNKEFATVLIRTKPKY